MAAILAALLLVALNLRSSLASVGPVVETIRAELALSHSAVSLLTTLPIVCMGLFASGANWLQSRFGIRNAVTGSLALLALGTAARLAQTWMPLLLSTLLVGIAIAVLGPLLGAFIKQRFPDRSSWVTSVLTTGLCLSAALAASATAPLNQLWGSWRWALASWALPALLGCVVWQRTLAADEPLRPREHDAPAQNPWKALRAWQLLWVFGLQSAMFYVLLTWLAPAYVEFGLSEAAAGGLLGLMTLTQLGGTLLIGMVAQRSADRRPWLLLCSLLTLLGCVAVAWKPLTLPWLWMSLLGIGTAGLFTLTLILPLDYGATPAAAGSWTAMMLSGGYLISAIGPYFAGVLRETSDNYQVVFVALAVAVAALGVSCLFLAPPQRSHHS